MTGYAATAAVTDFAASATSRPNRRRWLTTQSLDRAAEADRSDDLAAAVAHRSADRGNAGLAFLDALGNLVALQNTTGGSAVHWKQCPLRNDPAQPVRGLQRNHAAATLALPAT